MKTGNGKLVIKVPSTEQQENLKNSRKTLKVLQQSAENKENLVGRTLINKYPENETEKPDFKKKKLSNKSIQTGKDNVITVEDLTTEEAPSEQYWKVLAEKRREALDDTLKENEVLHKQIEILKEENKTCKEMLEETKNLVEVLTTTSIGAQVDNLSSEIRIVNDNILQSTRSLSIETNNDSNLKVQENSNKHSRTVSEEDTKVKEQLQKDTENCYFLTGTVEKVISWNKLLVNTRTFFEVIAKCLSIHEGITPITKQLLIRNERGPVLQVFYYEIDFSLDSEVTPGEYIRCVGHMVESNKLVAYTVQLATLHEVTTLQRFTFISDNVARKISNFTTNMK